MGHVTRAIAILAALGATLGVALDAWHVQTATTRYTSPTFLDLAWWTWPLFASAPIGLGLVPVAIERAIGRPVEPCTWPRVAIAMVLFVAAYLVTGILRGVPCAIVLLGIAAALVVVTRVPIAIGLIHAIGAAIGGPLVEIALVHAGLFAHADTTLFGVAIWLPMLYVCASLAITSLARRLTAPEATTSS